MDELEELLAESEPVLNAEWKEYVFDLIRSAAYKYLVIQAYFSDENASPASGHEVRAYLWHAALILFSNSTNR